MSATTLFAAFERSSSAILRKSSPEMPSPKSAVITVVPFTTFAPFAISPT